jgi:glycine/D-amino acid oxidase-like deaminating enzyme
MEVIVVGAGVTGLAIAHRLLDVGAAVQIVERDGIGAGASGVQPGGVRRQWRTEANCRLAQESFDFYRGLPERLGVRVDAPFTECGYAFVAHTQARLDELAAGVSVQQGLGIPSRLLSAEETAEVVPDLDSAAICGAAWCGEDGYFDRAQAPLEAFSEAVLRAGAELVRAEVRTLDELEADAVVVAAGADSAALLATIGVELPIVPEPRHLFFSGPVSERILDPLVVDAELGFAAKQLADGRVLASDLRGDGGPAEWRETIRQGFDSLLPRLTALSFSELVSGVYDVTSDHDPILGPVADGVWVAAGFSGHGFMLAPAVGRLVAGSVIGVHDPLLDAYSLTRFAGSTRRAVETQVI